MENLNTFRDIVTDTSFDASNMAPPESTWPIVVTVAVVLFVIGIASCFLYGWFMKTVTRVMFTTLAFVGLIMWAVVVLIIVLVANESSRHSHHHRHA